MRKLSNLYFISRIVEQINQFVRKDGEIMDYSKLSYFYEPTSSGRTAKIAKIEALLHKKVVMHMANFKRHIKRHHPEVTVGIIYSVLTDPDVIYRRSKHGKEFSYQRSIDGVVYRVIVAPSDFNRKAVITAYRVVKRWPDTDLRPAHCSYSRENTYYADICNVYDSITAEYAQMLACG